MNVLYVLSLCAVAVFAISGALSAGRKQFDLFGAVVIAVVTAIGGGTVRDLLLDRNPVFWIGDTRFLIVSSAAGLIAVLYARHNVISPRWLLYADGLGFAFFTISGTRIAEHVGVSPGVCVLMGCITGVAGGVLRDVLSGEAPILFRNRELYATAGIAGAVVYLLLYRGADVAVPISAVTGMAVIILLRFGSLWWKFHMPMAKVRE